MPTLYQKALSLRHGDWGALRDVIADIANDVDKLNLTVRPSAGNRPTGVQNPAASDAGVEGEAFEP